eukprot:763282-Hanusia_phi.AAC.1
MTPPSFRQLQCTPTSSFPSSTCQIPLSVPLDFQALTTHCIKCPSSGIPLPLISKSLITLPPQRSTGSRWPRGLSRATCDMEHGGEEQEERMQETRKAKKQEGREGRRKKGKREVEEKRKEEKEEGERKGRGCRWRG